MIIKRTPEELNERHAQLDRGIARQEPVSIALGLIRSLNQDNDCNYSFTCGQVELLASHVQAKLGQFQGNSVQEILFTEKLIDDIVCGGVNPEHYEEICEVLDQIFSGVDENGDELVQKEQPFHFDAYPFALNAE